MGGRLNVKSSGFKVMLETFSFHRTLTIDLLCSLGNEQLTCRPIKGFGSFGKQFRHILDAQRCYVDSIFTFFLNFQRDNIYHSLESTVNMVNVKTALDCMVESSTIEKVTAKTKTKSVTLMQFDGE